MSAFKMPERNENDGAVGVSLDPDGAYVLTAVQGGTEYRMKVGVYNVWRLFGMLAVMLGVRLTKPWSTGIKF